MEVVVSEEINSNHEDKSPHQKQEEQDYLYNQKVLLEQILLELSNTKINIFNFFKLLKMFQRLMLILGGSVTSSIFKQIELSKNDTIICDMVKHLHDQVINLNDRIKKIESK